MTLHSGCCFSCNHILNQNRRNRVPNEILLGIYRYALSNRSVSEARTPPEHSLAPDSEYYTASIYLWRFPSKCPYTRCICRQRDRLDQSKRAQWQVRACPLASLEAALDSRSQTLQF